jgi:methylenetetrahydrofolate dehydrogenase (NADP+)/methenyltetrahydrofolate cyclohydrolase
MMEVAMPAQLIDGKGIAKGLLDQIKSRLAQSTLKPGLAVVQVGDNPASATYVSLKEKDCQSVGILSEKHHLPVTTTEPDLLRLVDELNRNKSIHGILVQLPLPDGIDTHRVLNAIDPAKDVDGFHTRSLGELLSGNEFLVPCTPKGVIHLIESTGVRFAGKKAVVVGRSVIVGKPVAMMLLNRHAVVTICHSKTPDLGAETRMADILVVAAGRPKLVNASMVKPGSVVIDVGINFVNGKMVGDVDFESVKDVAGHLSPVPGGVGPMTRAMLLHNTLLAAGVP